MHRSSTIYKKKQCRSKQTSLGFGVRGQQSMALFTEESAVMDYGLIYCPEVTV